MKVNNVAPKSTVTFKTSDANAITKGAFKWWLAKDKKGLAGQLLSTVAYLKENQSYLYRQTALYARLYGNMSLFSFAGSNMTKMDTMTGLPADRPTFNLVQSAVDTLVARLSQSRPAPTFLTDGGDYKERRIAKQLNNFILGEFYQTKAYDKATIALRDACVTGSGVIKIYESEDNKVALERVLKTELLCDPNDAMYGEPRQLFQLKLVDREVLMAIAPGFKAIIEEAATAFPDNSSDSSKTIADQVMIVEAWHLPSSKKAKDGRHTIACSSGVILDEVYTKDKFPFVFVDFSPRLLGFWAQGLAEQLMGTQLEINSILFTISRAIKLTGVPRVFVEAGSKVSKASFNNDVGAIIEYRGVKPSYEVSPVVPQELYAQLQRLIDYGYQQAGVSALQATSEKPAGLNSGEAIRSYDDISSDRFATLAKRYDNLFVDLAYAMTDLAKDIAERDGKYQTIYPNKDGTKEIDLPNVKMIQDPFVIQVFNQSSLPKDPSGRMQKVTEMIQAGMITIKEGRRLLDYPDLDQVEKLANASEERIYQILDKIVEEGEYTPPDPFMDLQLANDLSVQYYNLYMSANLEEDKAQMLRDFFSQVQTIKQAATPPPMAVGSPGGPVGSPSPAAAPQTLPTSPLVPNGNPGGAQ
jgi:hypothetical protein